MNPDKSLGPVVHVEPLILFIRGHKVIVDADLARIYGVRTKVLNQAVKRNLDRFPEDFMFQLTPGEKAEVVTNCDHLKRLKFSPVLPNVFTEHGAIMAATILNSSQAVGMSIFVVRAFIKLREQLSLTRALEKRLLEIEKKLLVQGDAVRDLYQSIKPLLVPPPERPRRQIGFRVRERKSSYFARIRKGREQ
jgi:hypothetical protein